MSSYNHTIGFKVLIDSGVVDFTFRVPRGTLLIQILDELKATLKVSPEVLAAINQKGEIVPIENQYSPIDFLIQKYGMEFYAGESSFVTFHYDQYVVDLEVPRAIPFAATYRTACKGFGLNPLEVGIERQNGQIMDVEIFTMPTAFVLNSWGNYYSIIEKDIGDVYLEPMELNHESSGMEIPEKIEQMVYPPKLDGSDIIEAAKELIDITHVDESEVDTLTKHFVDRVISDSSAEKKDSVEEFLTKPIDEAEKSYPWTKLSNDLYDQLSSKDKSLESLMDEITFDDELDNEGEKEYEEVPPIQTIIPEPIKQPLQSKETLVEEIFQDIFAEEEEEKVFRASPLDEIEEDKKDEDEEELTPEKVEVPLVEVLEFFDEKEVEEEDYSDSYDLPQVSDDEIFEDEEPMEEEKSSDLPDTKEVIFQEYIESEISSYQEEDDNFTTELMDTEVVFEESSFAESIVESIEKPSEVGLVNESPNVDDVNTTDDSFRTEKPITEDVSKSIVEKGLTLEERLNLRKKELEVLEASLRAEESVSLESQQRFISIDYYQRMFPQKIYPLHVRILAGSYKDSNLSEIHINPIFPGCYITPSVEIIDLTEEKMVQLEFNITPIVQKGTINGKVSIGNKRKNLHTINITSKVINPFWSKCTGTLTFIVGIFTILGIIFLNSKIAEILTNASLNRVFLGVEVALFVSLLAVTLGLIFGLKPNKKTLNKKFSLATSKNNT